MSRTKAKQKKSNRTILVSVSGDEEVLFLESLLKKLGVKSRLLSEDEKEDIALGVLMKEAENSGTVSYEKVMKKLRGT